MKRVAILGAGIGAQHLTGFRALPDQWEVRLIVDQDITRARQLDPTIPTANEIETALASPKIDVIDICLPPHLHVPVALAAMKAGKDVICEKPIATSLTDVQRLRRRSDKTGQRFFPIFQYRFGPGFAALDELREAALLGDPMMAALETHWARGPDYYAVDWRGTWAGEQGGAILGHAIHAHDLLAHHMGGIASVSASLTTKANPIETDDCAAISFELAGGGLATSSVTLGAARDETRLRFVFDKLTATSGDVPYTPASGDWTFTARNAQDQYKVDAVLSQTPKARAGYAGAFEEVAKAMDDLPNKAVSFEDGARSIELVTAIYRSARTHRKVALPLHSRHPLRTGWLP